MDDERAAEYRAAWKLAVMAGKDKAYRRLRAAWMANPDAVLAYWRAKGVSDADIARWLEIDRELEEAGCFEG